MRYTNCKRTIMLGAVLAIAPLGFADTPRQGGFAQAFDESFAAPSTKAQEEVSNLLKEISVAAFQTSVHAGRLQSFVRNHDKFSRETHSSELNLARDKINSKGKALERLKELRSEALPWQQLAMDRVQPLLAKVATNATEAIEYLNKDWRLLHPPEYKEAISNMYIYADEVRDMIAVKLDYAEARANLNELEAKLSNP